MHYACYNIYPCVFDDLRWQNSGNSVIPSGEGIFKHNFQCYRVGIYTVSNNHKIEWRSYDTCKIIHLSVRKDARMEACFTLET